METKLNFTYNPEGNSLTEILGLSEDRFNELIDEYNNLLNQGTDIPFLEPIKTMNDNNKIKTLEELLILFKYAGFRTSIYLGF